MLSIALSMSSLIFYRQKGSINSVKSTQSYYASEAGIEDALMRLRNNPLMPPLNYSLTVGGATTNVIIPEMIAGSRTVDSNGDALGRIRNLQVIYQLDSYGVSFNYGIQVGEGGLEMKNGSKVKGNVFSNGNIFGGNGTVEGDVVVAGNGHSIDDITVEDDAISYSCLSPAKIKGNLTYVTGGTRTCAVTGSISTQSQEIQSEPLPISQSQIDQWKEDATGGGVINGDYTIGINQSQNFGPKKITGKLTVSNGATLTITGNLYVLGDIVFDNDSTIKLDSSYGSNSGVILSDGKIEAKNGVSILGSGQSESYILVLSTNNSNSAIVVDNNATGAVFYTNIGGIELKNNAGAKELTGYKIKLNNNAEIEYETGLANLLFSSGPSGGWKVLKWKEQ
jgi:hypothetical protein